MQKTAWPSYHVSELVIKSVGMLSGFVEVKYPTEDQITIKIKNSNTMEAIKNIFGDLFRGVKVSYECTKK